MNEMDGKMNINYIGHMKQRQNQSKSRRERAPEWRKI